MIHNKETWRARDGNGLPQHDTGYIHRYGDNEVEHFGGNQWSEGFLSSWRAIAVRGGGSGNIDINDTDHSQLKHAPNGLGMLMTGGYIPNSQGFYCPSSEGMVGTVAKQVKEVNPSNNYDWGPRAKRHWQFAGGFDVETMMYGNWRPGSSGYEAGMYDDEQNAIFSNYSYRNVFLGFIFPPHWYECEDPEITGIIGTKPLVPTRPGGALFPTDRQLNGRAIASDGFGMPDTHDALGRKHQGEMVSADDSRDYAGFGITGHRTGYNVLYGDGSARFYGDPGETIVWHLWDDEDGDAISQHWHGSGTRFWKHVMAVNHASFDDYPGAEIGVTGSAGGNNDPEDDSFKGTPWEIWHHFDNGQQIDVF